jgi:hypothetical protein
LHSYLLIALFLSTQAMKIHPGDWKSGKLTGCTAVKMVRQLSGNTYLWQSAWILRKEVVVNSMCYLLRRAS